MRNTYKLFVRVSPGCISELREDCRPTLYIACCFFEFSVCAVVRTFSDKTIHVKLDFPIPHVHLPKLRSSAKPSLINKILRENTKTFYGLSLAQKNRRKWVRQRLCGAVLHRNNLQHRHWCVPVALCCCPTSANVSRECLGLPWNRQKGLTPSA